MKRTATFRRPTITGKAALRELDLVPWGELRHAYGKGVVGEGLHGDLRTTLERLGEDDRESFAEGLDTLWSNACHQGTIYEATAHAVPFLAAVAQDPSLSRRQVAGLFLLLGHIGVAAAWETDDGSCAGSLGEGVAETTRAALMASRVWIAAMAERCPELADSAGALVALVEAREPTDALVTALRETLDELDSVDIEEDPEPAAGPEEWVRHPKFGAGRVVSRQEGKVRVAFGGDEPRLLLASVVTPCDPPS